MYTLGRFLWRFMVIFSFIVNIILVIVLIAAGLFIFEIKKEIAEPLVTGLHSSFVGLDQATIDWTIPVRDQIPVRLDIPLQANTDVVLTADVPLTVNATIIRQGVDILGGPVSVRLTLPRGTNLPVALNMNVPVDQPLDVSLDVRAVIPLQGTQLHDVADNLRLLFEPLASGLTNLPNDFGEAGELVGDVLSGDFDAERDLLLAENAYTQQPWPGFSTTAGLGYQLASEPVPRQNLPLQTGIVPMGGIQFMDEVMRPELYQNSTSPEAINASARLDMDSRNINAIFYNGQVGQELIPVPASTDPLLDLSTDPGSATGGQTQPTSEDLGVIAIPDP
jgi:hypothetical protein